jgi:hypothetical protein
VNVILETIAARLYDQHRAPRHAEVPHGIDPIRQRMVSEYHSLPNLLGGGFDLRRPDDQEGGSRPHEQRMRAVIDILSAEIPDMQDRRFHAV